MCTYLIEQHELYNCDLNYTKCNHIILQYSGLHRDLVEERFDCSHAKHPL